MGSKFGGEIWKLLEALCYETMGQLSKAKRLFKDILKEQPLLIGALHGLAMVMHKTHDPSLFDMLMDAMEVSRRGNRVTEERNIQVLIGQMHIVKDQKSLLHFSTVFRTGGPSLRGLTRTEVVE